MNIKANNIIRLKKEMSNLFQSEDFTQHKTRFMSL